MKKETLEEAAYRLSSEKFEPKHIGFMLGVIEGSKWQAERMYSEEEVKELLKMYRNSIVEVNPVDIIYLDKWFEKYKKK